MVAEEEQQQWHNPIIVSLQSLRVDKEEVHDPISQYDDIFKSICNKYGHDWLFLSAIASVESHFRANAQSRAGARGLMQIMPRTASIYHVDSSDLFDPETSIDIANRYLLEIEQMLTLPDSIAHDEKLSLALAAYNGGIGRIFDAQRLARAAGADPYSWDQLKHHLLRLRDEEYYTRPEVRYGGLRAGRSGVCSQCDE